MKVVQHYKLEFFILIFQYPQKVPKYYPANFCDQIFQNLPYFFNIQIIFSKSVQLQST